MQVFIDGHTSGPNGESDWPVVHLHNRKPDKDAARH
jgi:hypothetical protein